jgi:hypothetical protein
MLRIGWQGGRRDGEFGDVLVRVWKGEDIHT